jgi:glycolate oxidase FAD binding subunit
MTHRPTSVSELAALIDESAAAHRALRLIGRGTWLDGGAPVEATATPVELGAFAGIVEYEPGDLTITVGASMTISELDTLTAAHSQWCPLAPWGGDDGSVGATIATATSGPFASALGGPRDFVLGLECVDGTGRTLRPGGKVVKNVAGFDLVRLMTGSWGTLAAITQLSLRLRARPAVDESWTLTTDTHDAAAAMRTLRQSATPPVACELLSEGASVGGAHLLVRLAGNRAYVDAARSAVQRMGGAAATDATAWDALRRTRHLAAARRVPSVTVRALNESVKRAFDPANILNPGIMG